MVLQVSGSRLLRQQGTAILFCCSCQYLPQEFF
nr:MAG TPA: hypothetical protein [Caudoviricetes sp.]